MSKRSKMVIFDHDELSGIRRKISNSKIFQKFEKNISIRLLMTEEDWNWNFTDFLTDNSRFNSSCPQRDRSRCLNERTEDQWWPNQDGPWFRFFERPLKGRFWQRCVKLDSQYLIMSRFFVGFMQHKLCNITSILTENRVSGKI